MVVKNHISNISINNLDLSKYVVGYDSVTYYDLYGICNHSGGTMSGHYTWCKECQ